MLHPTSLPGAFGCGDLGAAARDFVDWLASAGQGWWQMLPIGPTDPYGSPYCSTSAFAGNPLLIDPEDLTERGWLTREQLRAARMAADSRVDYRATARVRMSLLRDAFRRFRDDKSACYVMDAFAARETAWLDDLALFNAIRESRRGAVWTRWETPLRERKPAALRGERERLRERYDFHVFVQWLFDEQWRNLRDYAAKRGVALLGDIPIFVSHDSADVWAHPELFRLDRRGNPEVISGVPPDYFSRTGQLWGHPLFRWERHLSERFAWWVSRLRRAAAQFDASRIDHFLGFHRCWATPFGDKTAERGEWTLSPGRELFTAVRRELGRPEIVAEDLGAVTPQAAKLRDAFEFPGMRIFQFGFGVESTYHLPHQYERRSVAYTGTHDNETVMGWFRRVFDEKTKGPDGLTTRQRVMRYCDCSTRDLHRAMWRILSASSANVVVAPIQDLLGLGNEARMNRPGVPRGNWVWRMDGKALRPRLAEQLRDIAEAYERATPVQA